MRFILAVLFAVVLSPAFAQQYKKGDKVIVIKNNAPIKKKSEIVDKGFSGLTLTVTDVNGRWLEVHHKHRGWINQNDVASFDKQAIDRLTRMIEGSPDDTALLTVRARISNELRLFDIAIADYTTLIGLNQTQSSLYSNRGGAWYSKGNIDKALSDYDEAIRLNPNSAYSHSNRGLAWFDKGDYDQAISDFNNAIGIDPKFISAYFNRGRAWNKKRDFDKAISDFGEAIRLNPNHFYACHELAWIRATCPREEYRNGADAVQFAERTNKLTSYKHYVFVSTLAAAYAENGQFDKAVEFQKRAISGKSTGPFLARLKLYQQRQPYREEE